MSTTADERQLAHRALFISLINDAALFPPAARAMATALEHHETHTGGEHADLVGPFLVGAPAVGVHLAALDAGSAPPPRVGLVARPRTPVDQVEQALRRLREDPRSHVVSLDIAWNPQWRNLDTGDLPVNLEVGREGRGEALDDIATAAGFADVRAKFRTGPTPAWPWPDADELADFVLGAAQRHLPFVLTGGLHHVVRGEHMVHGEREEQHGLLNVLVAVHAAAGGGDARTVRDLLEVREAEALADVVAGWSAPDVAAVRAAFASYGCCDVTDPLGELTDLGLLPAPKG